MPSPYRPFLSCGDWSQAVNLPVSSRAPWMCGSHGLPSLVAARPCRPAPPVRFCLSVQAGFPSSHLKFRRCPAVHRARSVLALILRAVSWRLILGMVHPWRRYRGAVLALLCAWLSLGARVRASVLGGCGACQPGRTSMRVRPVGMALRLPLRTIRNRTKHRPALRGRFVGCFRVFQ